MITSSGRSRSWNSSIAFERSIRLPCGGSRAFRGISMRCGLALALMVGLLAAGCSSERRLTVKATAFNSTRAQTDARSHETACGVRLQPGDRVIAVSRDLTREHGLVCGTEIVIDGLEGTWTVVDVTAARHQKLIDIYMGRDVKAARQWGVREVAIRWRKSGPN